MSSRQLVVALWTGLVCGNALADGGMFWISVAEAGNSGDQRAIILHNGETETLLVETAAENARSDYAWIVPTPGVVDGESLSDMDADVFDRLAYAYSPGIVVSSYTGGGYFGCWGCAGGGLAGGDDRQPAVTVWDTRRVGVYELVTLTATESAALQAWLTDNGYAVPPGAEAVIGDYVERGWAFTAVRVAPAAEQLGVPLSLRPLALSFPAAQPVYPLLISSVSAADSEREILLYVIARNRVDAGPYPTVELDTSVLRGTDPLEAYTARVRAQARAGGQAAFVVECSEPYVHRVDESLVALPGYPSGDDNGSPVVTRLRAYMRASDMTHDVVFETASAEEYYFSPILSFEEDIGGTTAAKAAGLVVVGMCGSMLGRRPRRRMTSALLTVALAAALVL